MWTQSEVRWDSRCLLNRATKAGPVAAARFWQCASWAPSWGSFLATEAKHAGCPGGTELPSRRQTAKLCRPGIEPGARYCACCGEGWDISG